MSNADRLALIRKDFMFCAQLLPHLPRLSHRLAQPTRRRGEGAPKGRNKALPCEQMTRIRGRLSGTRRSAARALSSRNEPIQTIQTMDPAIDPVKTGRREDQGTLLPVKGLSFPELVSFCREVLEEEHPEKRARQLWRWMYSDYRWVQSLEDAAAGMCWGSRLDGRHARRSHSRLFSRDNAERVFEGISG